MSLIIFANLGLAPISGALSGYFFEYIGLKILKCYRHRTYC